MTMNRNKWKSKLGLYSLKLNYIHRQILKFLKKTFFQQRTDGYLRNRENCWTGLQSFVRIMFDWTLMMMMKFPLQDFIHCITMFTLFYAHTDYFSSLTGTHPFQNPSTKTTLTFQHSDDPIRSYPMISQLLLHLPQEKQACKKSLAQNIVHLPRKNRMIPKSNLFTYIHRGTTAYWKLMNNFFEKIYALKTIVFIEL